MAKKKRQTDTEPKKRKGIAAEVVTNRLTSTTPLAHERVGKFDGSDPVEQQPGRQVQGGQLREAGRRRQPTDEGITSYSVRLTDQQRDLLVKAAELRGWTPTSLIRTAALEKATHVLNLSVPNSFDFSGAAKRIAEVLLAPRDASLILHVGTGTLGRFGEGQVFDGLDYTNPDELRLDEVGLHDFRPAPLTREQVEELHEAMRLGGTEFAAELIVECRRLGSIANDPNLPPPLDPHNLKD